MRWVLVALVLALKSLYIEVMIWPFIFLSYASLFVFGLSDNIRGPLFPEIMKQFAISDSMGSLMFALSNISGFFASYGCRYLLRRYDRLTVLRGGAMGLTISMWGMAASTYFPLFLFFSFFFGLSLGVLGLVPNILVPMGSSPHRKQQMLSGLHTMYGMASLLAPLLAASMEYLTGSWRWTFVAGSIGPLSLLVYTLHGSHKSLHTKAEFSPEKHKANKQKNFKPQLFLAVMLSLAVAAEIMVSSRLALYMQRTWNYDMEASSLYVTYFFISMMLGRFLFTVVHFKRSPQFLLSASLILTAVFILAGVFVHPLFLAASGFMIAPFYPLSISWISSEFPEDLDSAVSYMMATDSLMLIIMHLTVGKLTDLFSIKQAILWGLGFVILSFFMVNGFAFLFKRERQGALQEVPAK
ncbi:sugar MFS transporter [Bdellovibrio bacteriovorus]|uniref:MFS transporter n=1 Tax=Bdellovibrio bacteriovorus TaxID=959 RepID=UPI0035A88D11